MVLQRILGRTTSKLERPLGHAQALLLFLYPSLAGPRQWVPQQELSDGTRTFHSSRTQNRQNGSSYNLMEEEEDLPFADIPPGLLQQQRQQHQHQDRQSGHVKRQSRHRGEYCTARSDRTAQTYEADAEDDPIPIVTHEVEDLRSESMGNGGDDADPWGYLVSDGIKTSREHREVKRDLNMAQRASKDKRFWKDNVAAMQDGDDYQYPLKYSRKDNENYQHPLKYARKHNDNYQRPPKSGRSTIRATAEERAAFNEILSTILMRNEQRIYDLGAKQKSTSQSSPLLAALFQGIRGEKDELSFNTTGGPSVKQKTLLKPKKSKGNSQIFIEHLALLRRCSTDLELWNFLEDHVFSLVSSANDSSSTEEKKEANSSSEKAPKRKSKRADKGKFTVPAENYADMIEAAMYILRVEFQDYSGSISVFERVKQLGAESYVVGCSTGVYNELIEAQWSGHRDMQRIGEILEEMQSNGIVSDAKTGEIVQRAILEAKEIACNTDLAGGAPLWANIDAASQVNHVNKMMSQMGFKPENIVGAT